MPYIGHAPQDVTRFSYSKGLLALPCFSFLVNLYEGFVCFVEEICFTSYLCVQNISKFVCCVSIITGLWLRLSTLGFWLLVVMDGFVGFRLSNIISILWYGLGGCPKSTPQGNMKFLAWDCRGFRATLTIRRLCRILKQKNLTVVFFG